jgi:hypothetical protein
MWWPDLTYGNRFTFIVMCIIISALITDTSIVRIYYLNVSISSYEWTLLVFIIISVVSVAGQLFLLRYVNEKSSNIRARKKLHLQVMHRVVVVSVSMLVSVNILVISQMIIMSAYNVASLTIAAWISYGLCIAFMGLLAQRFFSWFNAKRNYVILSYGLSSAAIALNAAFTMLYVPYYLFNLPALAMPHPGFNTPYIPVTPLTTAISSGHFMSSVASFVATWVSTVLLLYQYSRRLGAVRYWFVVSIPLIYFLLQFYPLVLNLFLTFSQSQPVIFSILYTLVFTMSLPTGGVLFGIAYWFVSRTLPHQIVIREYLVISAFGFVLLFVSNQGITLVSAPYPPFGLPTISFFGVASYLILVGIYSSAISVSEDSTLRQMIRSLTTREPRLLDSIGTAHMEQEIQERVIALTKQNQERMAEETGIEPSLTDDEMKQYLEEVINEVRKQKSTTTKNTSNGSGLE